MADRQELRRHFFVLALIPLLANAVALAGFFNCDPETIYSGLGHWSSFGPMPGAACYVDPTVAYITQPLGHLSAEDWLHGIIPWWNPYSGVGMPLAAEMQAESFFFPFVLLLHFHAGWLYQRVLFQCLAGIFTYMFLLDLGLLAEAALLGGVLFSLNGTFFLVPHAAIAPIFFLPLTLIGINRTYRAAMAGRAMGWSVVTLGLAGAVYAGYPEVAYFNGLLAVVWTLFRGAELRNAALRAYILKMAAGVVVGLALSAPLLLPFFQYLAVAQIGSHSGLFAHDTQSAAAVPLQIFPYFYGGLGVFIPPALQPVLHDTWVRIGGWYGVLPVLLALYAALPKGRRLPGRGVLLGWVLFWQARYSGVPGTIFLANLIPGVASADVIRFSALSVEFAVFALAACGFDDLRRAVKTPNWGVVLWLGTFFSLVALAVVPAFKFYPAWFYVYPQLRQFVAVYFVAVALAGGFLVYAVISRRFFAAVKYFAMAESFIMFLLPQYAAPRVAKLDLAGLAVLHGGQDFGRLYTLGPLAPNDSALYKLAAINYAALPVPALWTDYLTGYLFAGADQITFGGGQNGQSPAFWKHFSSYEAIGVKYLITLPGGLVTPGAAAPAPGWNSYVILRHGQVLKNSVPPLQGLAGPVSRVSVQVGTFLGQSTGVLRVQLCTGGHCAAGQAALDHAADNQPLAITLDHKLFLQAGQSLDYEFTHPSGYPVAVQTAPVLVPDSSAPPVAGADVGLAFATPGPADVPQRIYADQSMDIYQLPNPAPYAQLMDATCKLVVFSRQKMDADCTSPTTLIRREMFFPGWRVQLNGKDAPIARGETIFQQVNLPDGPVKIRFSYMPPYTPLACFAAILAALFWAAAGFASRRGAKN